MDAAGGGVGEGVGDAAAVADDKQAGIAGFQLLARFHFHVVELYFHAVEQGVVVGGAGGDLIQGVDHFDDAIQDALGQHQAQIAGGGVEGMGDKMLSCCSTRRMSSATVPLRLAMSRPSGGCSLAQCLRVLVARLLPSAAGGSRLAPHRRPGDCVWRFCQRGVWTDFLDYNFILM